MAKEHSRVYFIPENFIEGGRIVNGMFKTRNFVEALVLGGIAALILWHLPLYSSVISKITVTLCVSLPLFVIGLIGINGQSLLQFVQKYVKWRKGKGVMLYNYNVKSRPVRPMRVMFSQELPKDRLIKKIDDYKEAKRKKNSKQSFIEGKDFEFMDEEFSQSFRSTEKKILDATNKPKKQNKKALLITDGKNKNAAPAKTSTKHSYEGTKKPSAKISGRGSQSSKPVKNAVSIKEEDISEIEIIEL